MMTSSIGCKYSSADFYAEVDFSRFQSQNRYGSKKRYKKTFFPLVELEQDFKRLYFLIPQPDFVLTFKTDIAWLQVSEKHGVQKSGGGGFVFLAHGL